MKHSLIISLLLVFIVSSCVVNTPKQEVAKFSNPRQADFCQMLANNREKSYGLGNSILEKEFNDSIKSAIGHYMDSVQLFYNWTGKITDINSRESGNSIALSFNIIVNEEEYHKVEFAVDYIVSKDSLTTDKIYNSVKYLSNFSTIYFDGFIRTTAEGDAHYDNYDILGTSSTMHSYPDFKFFIIDINDTSKGDTIPTNLSKAVDLSFKAIEPLKLNFKKEISKKESDRRVKAIAPEFKAAKEVLTQEETSYINRLTQAITLNFIYAD